MVQYYYDKYSVNSTPIYGWRTTWSGEVIIDANTTSGYTSYSVDGSGNFVTSGSYITLDIYSTSGTTYNSSGKTMTRTSCTVGQKMRRSTATSKQEQTGTSESRGSLIQPDIIAEDGAYPANGIKGGYWYVKKGVVPTNNVPIVLLTSPGDNYTLYENDTLNITGTAYDDDKDQSVTAYYQINSESRKVLATNLSQTQISLSKQLTFKAGKLYDVDTPITGDLADGVAHTLKVWAVDSENAQSVVAERTFYVVANRAPLLSVDAVIPSGVVDTDKFTISGNASDQDANANVTVTQRINGGNAIEIYNGPGGAWDFDVSLAQLTVGQNTIIIEVIDNYGAKSSKTIKLNKNEVKTPILQSVARYKIEQPKGSAKGVLLWIQRDEDLADLKVKLSMNLQGEQESYTTLTATNTAPVDSEIVEDEFYFEADEAKNNIILKLSTSRADINIDHKIHLISGVLE